ncbi:MULTISPECIES: hypothetical protein [unclassified Kitasatospora]|uniref:hypothetical protein n=1 Tax=unclassified Kitasatospora TaxID=2633591 RepID=UPI00070AF35C|nr:MULTISPECIES: hypothetical protein [unclassified Kitasatospora]KQV22888.1 hypothetical protein ASC99_17240 [Kitasatospora sp. Root107]KRB61748.1 hypothetical protein ASE03_09025 [Kitasatospora sp. Root187]
MTDPELAPGGPAVDPRGWALPRTVGVSQLGPFAEPISEHNGQAIAVRPLTDHPGWLAKLYRPDMQPEDAHRIDRLISAPDTLPEADRAALYAGTCWPAARIHEPGNPAVGCVIPMAPDQYRAELRRGKFSERRFVEIDWLAKSDESIRRVGLPGPGFEGRLAACRRLTELAAILEGLGLVYSDWSFSNAFWSPDRRSVYLIDVDGCQPEKMPDLHQPNWADPLTPPGTDADRYTDRYRLGLLIAKCLTGQRDADAFHTVAAASWREQPAAAEVLLDMLLAADRERRPSAAQLDQALNSGPYLRPVPRPTRTALPLLPVPITVPAGTGPAVERPESAFTKAAREQATGTAEKQDSTTDWDAGWIWVLVIAVILIIIIASNH